MAFNVLLGSKSGGTGPATRTFADVAYLKQSKLIEESDNHVKVKFTKRKGPEPYIKEFTDRQEEKDWVAGEIVRLVEKECVRPEDILVLFNRSVDFKDFDEVITRQDRNRLIEGFKLPFNHGNRGDQDTYIFEPGHVTISTIHGAKGYDAMMVFLIGVDQFDDTPEDRAAFYVGATRSKLALYLTGIERKFSLLHEARSALTDMKQPKMAVPQ